MTDSNELSPADWLEVPVRIDGTGNIYFGDTKLPGCIADGSVIFNPGGAQEINKLTVTFYVGKVTADDPLAAPSQEYVIQAHDTEDVLRRLRGF